MREIKKTQIEEYFAHNEVAAIGVTLRNTDDTCLASQDFFLPRFKEIIDCIRERTRAPLILGGSGFSVMPEAILSYCDLELGIWGEGEYALPLLVGKIISNQDYRDIPGLVYRGEEGFRRNPPHYLGLGGIAAPRRDTVDNLRYLLQGGMGNVEAKRGCPKSCIYCADPAGKGRQLRLRSPESVADEIEALVWAGIDHFHFCDSEFNLPPSHAEEVCLKMVERRLGERVRWYAYASPLPFTDELATLLKKAGCAGINFGVDSGCNDILRALGRDFTVEDLEQTARICHRQGIVFMYDLLLGGPGETRQSIKETVDTMKRLSPSRVGAFLGVRIFPQTRLAEMVREQGPMAENPNLYGAVVGNENFFAPIFYLSSGIGAEAADYLSGLIGDDERFFFGSGEASDKNYNYNDNTALVNAIRDGYRGAFWDILRRIANSGRGTN